MLGAGISIGIGLSAGRFFCAGHRSPSKHSGEVMETGGGPVNA
jgi:hypothetical protein